MRTSKKPAPAAPLRKPSAAPVMEEAIRQRAYQFYEQRGREDGHALEDWLAAEAEIMNSKDKVTAT